MKTKCVWCAMALVVGAFVIAAAGCGGGTAARTARGTEQRAFMPYTETAAIEDDAKSAASAALADASLDALGYTRPTIVGHELVVWNADKSARYYVQPDGSVQSLGAGTVQQMLVNHSLALSDQGDRAAYAAAQTAFAAATGSPAEGGLVCAHAVRFTDARGSDIVVRTDVEGNTSFPDW